MSHRLSLDHIAAAMTIIDPVFLHTPQDRAEALEAVLGCQLVLKVETVNPIRSFKGRGASYLVSRLPAGSTIVCASAGNLGQAMAYACRAKGVPLLTKLKRSVIIYFDAAKAKARRVAQTAGIRLVEDNLDPETGEGAGTIVREGRQRPPGRTAQDGGS